MKRFRPGISFGDFVITDSSVRKSQIKDETELNFRRGWLVWLVIVFSMGFIGVRLATLQVFYGSRYRLMADENRINKIRLPAPRGKMLDRNGLVLAESMKDPTKPDDWIRYYYLGEAGSHVIGYVSEVQENEVGILKETGTKYNQGDIIGRSGLEFQYESMLRGQEGGRLVEVDTLGQEVREMGRKNPVTGTDLKLTLDKELQQAAYLAIGGKKGAVIASDPNTGEILALVSSPGFNPNEISTKYEELSTREDLPFFNRAIGGVYPPGSTFKMISIAAAIEENKVQPGFVFTDTGVIKVGPYTYYNWLFTKNGGTEGQIGFIRALTRSTDTFFYKIGEMTGPGNLAGWAKKLGLNELTGVDLPGEVVGTIPDPDWKEKYKKESWYLGDTYIMAIGQGDILVTPLQLNLMTNILATEGKKCKPHLLKAPITNNQVPNNIKCSNIQISKETLEIIKKGMVGACSPGGTAFPLFDWNEAALNKLGSSHFAKATRDSSLPLVACKTGTAEYMKENGRMGTHGWLTAFAPADNPQISVTVLMEGGGEGSNVAAPVVRKILAKYFEVEDKYPYGAIKQEISE